MLLRLLPLQVLALGPPAGVNTEGARELRGW